MRYNGSVDKNLQDQIHLWHLQNYPKDDAVSALLGIEEEIGELNRAVLKQEGGIRGTFDEWEVEQHKEAGDVLIGIINFAGFCGINLEATLLTVPSLGVPSEISSDIKTALLLLTLAHGKLVENFLGGIADRRASLIAQSYRNVEMFCDIKKFDPDEVLTSRWATISKRDFIANPETGGREKEA